MCLTVQVVQMQNAQMKPTNWLVLDGAHTAHSAAALTDTVREIFPDNPVALIIAMADDKDHKAVMAALRAVRPAVVVFTTVPIAGATQRWVAYLYKGTSASYLYLLDSHRMVLLTTSNPCIFLCSSKHLLANKSAQDLGRI